MRLITVSLFLSVSFLSGYSYAQYWQIFPQCMSGIQGIIYNCETYYSGYPNYQLIPPNARLTQDQYGNPTYLLQGGCLFDLNGTQNLLGNACFTDLPTNISLPAKGPYFPKPLCEQGSTIRVDEMSVSEEVALTGTPFNLVYTSERTLGNSKAYQALIGLPAGKKNLSAKDSYLPLSAVYNYSYANGRTGSATVIAGQQFSFNWDGKDNSGNDLEAPTKLSISAILNGSSYTISSDLSMAESIGTWNVKLMGLGGWNLDNHHLYDSAAQRIYFGSGATVSATNKFDGTTYQVFSEDGNEIYYFNADGRHLTTNNSLTNAVKYSFNYLSNGYLSSVVDAYGRTTSILRDSSGNPTGIQGPYGQVTQLTVGSDGYLASITNPKNETFQMTYYSGGLLYTFQKPKGQISTMVYNNNGGGSLSSDTSSNGSFINISKGSAANAPLLVDDAAGSKRTVYINSSSRTDYLRSGEVLFLSYVPHINMTSGENNVSSTSIDYGNDPRFGSANKRPNYYMTRLFSPSITFDTAIQRTVSNSSSSPTPFNYDSIQSQFTTNGKNTNTIYTRATGVTAITSPTGRVSSFTTDILGKVTNQTLASFQPVQYSYDSYGRLQYLSRGSRQTEIQYNSSGDISGVKNPLNQTTYFSYDLAGQVQSVTLPDSRVIGYTYDSNGNIASITPSGTNAHTFTFNPFDLPAYYTPPTVPTSTPATHYTYDNAKRITQITKPDSSNVNFNYSATTGLLTSIVASGDTTMMTIHPYSRQPQSITSPDGISTNQVYSSSLFVSSSATNSSSVNIGTVNYTYNNDFRPTTLVVGATGATTSSVAYTYDNDGLMQTAGSLGYSLDATTGFKMGSTLNKIQEAYSYDSSYGEPISFSAQYVPASGTSTPLFSQSYTRDNLGRIQTKTETVGTTTNQFAYTYDSTGRLTDVTKNAVAYSHYNFSSNNNLTSGNVGGVAFTATYDAQDRVLTYNTTANTSFTHTLNGEMKTKKVGSTTTTYTYNGFGMLKTAKVGSGAVTTYLYDGLNRLVGKMSGTTVQKYWVYQDQLRIAAELNSSGAITKKFIYGTKANVPEYMISGTTTYKIISDHLGSVRLVVNAATGAIAQKIEYNERGAVLSDSSAGFQPFYFAGGLYDTTTKLLHFGARYYDPSIGRWLSKDPIGFGGGDTNLYGYVLNDPINLIDPSGNCPWCIGAVVGGIASGTMAYLSGADAKGVMIAAGVGAISGGLTSGLSTLSALGTFGINSGAGFVGNAATQLAGGTSVKNLNVSSLIISSIAGGVGGVAGLGAGNAAFFRTPVIGNAIGMSAANMRALVSSTFVGTGIGSGIEAGALMCQ